MVMASVEGLVYWREDGAVARWGQHTAVGGVEAALNTGGPLQLADDAVGAANLLPDHRAEVRGGLGEDASALGEVGIPIGEDRGVPGLIEVVKGNVGVADDGVGL
jgi:hypothetical protein